VEVLLINHSLYTGGVETLIVRMANWVVRHGHGCSILLRDQFEGDLTPLLDSAVKLRIVGNEWDLLAIKCFRSLIWRSFKLPKPDVIYTLEQNWSVIGLLIRDVFRKDPPSVATGAYHINQFAYEQNLSNPGRLALLQRDIYNRCYLDSQKVFMSEETRSGHEAFFKRKIEEGWVWPLPIKIPDIAELQSRKPVPGRILSIGRLTRFKSYSWYMVPILQSLRKRHSNVQWHIYGSGMCEDELIQIVWKDAIRDGLIVFHGSIPYEQITKAFHEASVFVGMGTVLLEAAAAGVPAIPALVDDSEALSWGFIDKMPYFTVGETIPGMNPQFRVEDLLDEVLTANAADSDAIGTAGRRYVEPYCEDLLMHRFLATMNELDRGSELPAMICWRFIAIRVVRFFRNLALSISRVGQEPLRHPSGDRVIY
jgi:glycosyltransferase involved in cell wall biosynthesis